MTLEELLDCSAESPEKMSDKELNDYLSPYFNVTRPELQSKREAPKKSNSSDMELNLKLQKAREIAKSLGIEFP